MDVIYNNFKSMFPSIEAKTESWKEYGEFEIICFLTNGDRFVYDELRDCGRLMPKEYYDPKFDFPNEDVWKREFSRRLLRTLRLKHITQKELAELTGLSTLSINKYSTGKSLPNPIALAKIAKVLNCSVSYLTEF